MLIRPEQSGREQSGTEKSGTEQSSAEQNSDVAKEHPHPPDPSKILSLIHDLAKALTPHINPNHLTDIVPAYDSIALIFANPIWAPGPPNDPKIDRTLDFIASPPTELDRLLDRLMNALALSPDLSLDPSLKTPTPLPGVPQTSTTPQTSTAPQTSTTPKTSTASDALASTRKRIEIPVCYALGMDWDTVEAHTGLARDEVARRHKAGRYVVAMMGFMPGFLFLDGLDEAISCPRRGVPRGSVPEGAVGIAGHQTGIYSVESPGGWQIIGRSPRSFFDAGAMPPSGVEPGDEVAFVEITEEVFWQMRGKVEGEGEGEGASESDIAENKTVSSVGNSVAPSAVTAAATSPSTYSATSKPGSIEVLEGGLLTTIQDAGRFGFRKYGVPVAGVMDEHAHRQANAMIGNAPDAPVLEMTLIGGTFRFRVDGNATSPIAHIGIAGADAEIRLDGAPADRNNPIEIQDGSILEVGSVLARDAAMARDVALTKAAAMERDAATAQHSTTPQHSSTETQDASPTQSLIASRNTSATTAGCRIYMAVSGCLNLDPVMGSYSTSVLAGSGGFGGFKGRPLRKGDHIPYFFSRGDGRANRPIIPSGGVSNHGDEPHDASHQPDTNQPSATHQASHQPDTNQPHQPFQTHQVIRIMKGPEWEMLNRDQQKQFLRQEFGVSSQSNRMGIRLTGDPMLRSGDGTKTSCSGDGTTTSSASGTMTSSAVLPGTIQLPGNGLPIILMKDAQAVGGYARIAKVLNEDLWRLGQVWTRNTIRFELVEVGATSDTTSNTTSASSSADKSSP